MRELTPDTITDAVIDRMTTTPEPRMKEITASAAVEISPDDTDCPIPGVPSIRFDLRLSREGEADKTSGRVGSDPSAIPWEHGEAAKFAASAPAAS